MINRDRVLTQLEGEEGRRRSAYRDSLGYLTIGVGRLIDARKGGGLSEEEIDMLLSNDLDEVVGEIRAALPWTDYLDEARHAVIINMAFQMGTPKLLEFVNTLQRIRDQLWEQASQAMLKSLWAKQTPERAERMAEQMKTGKWQWKS